MTAPRTFRDIASDVVSGTEEEEIVETEGNEAPEEPKEDVKPEGDTKPTKEPEQTVKPFAEKPDLKGKTPEELEQIYKDWNAKYTQTRQRETEELKTYRTQVEQLQNQIKTLSNEGKKIEDPQLRNDAAEAKKQLELGKLTVEQYTEYMRKVFSEDAKRIAREEFTNLTSEQREQQEEEKAQQGAFEAFVSSDERLNEHSPKFDSRMFKSLTRDMEGLLDQHIADTGSSAGFDAKGHTQRLISEYDSEIDAIVKSRVENNTNLEKARAAKLAKTATSGKTGNSVSTVGKDFKEILREQISES